MTLLHRVSRCSIMYNFREYYLFSSPIIKKLFKVDTHFAEVTSFVDVVHSVVHVSPRMSVDK